MTAPGLNFLNYVGPLRKNKNATIDEDPIDLAPFDYDRFKRHLTGLLDRISRMCTTPSDQRSMDVDDTFPISESLNEEDDTINENTKGECEEESEWISDVKQTLDVLPRLQSYPVADQTNIIKE